MDLKVTVEYKHLSLSKRHPVERTVKFEDTEGKVAVLQQDIVPQDEIWKGTELLDDFMRKCFRDQLKFP